MKSSIAILTGKLAGKTSVMMGKGGSNIPGVVAKKIDARVLNKLSEQVENIILVTGTNGKTTTSKLIASILEAAGKKVMNNAEGANLITGITACFVKNSNLMGKVKFEYAILEVDEATIPLVIKQIPTPKMIVVNNFFRDQLDRYGEIDILINKMKSAIEPLNTKLILNGDDPFTHRFSLLEKENVYFGLNKDAYKFEKHEMTDSKFCPCCNNELVYEHNHYGQLGYFMCQCGFSRPFIQYEITRANNGEKMSFEIKNEKYEMSLKGIHNVYNASAAIAVAKEIGISDEDINKGLENYKSENGRMQNIIINDITHTLNLAKNPAGFNISLEDLMNNQEEKQVCLYLNDKVNDGRDISWIWDSDFEKLNRPEVKKIICSGIRAHDLAIRSKYAGIDEEKIIVIENKEEAIKVSIDNNLKTYHIPNYTALDPVRKILIENKNKIRG